MPNIVEYSRTQPSRTIVGIIVVLTFLAGVFLLTPWAIPTLGGPAVSVGFDVPHILGALVNCVFCLPAFWGVRQNTTKDLSRGAMYLFIWYTFVSILRIILSPAGSLLFVPTLILALVLGVIYLEQSYLAANRVGEHE